MLDTSPTFAAPLATILDAEVEEDGHHSFAGAHEDTTVDTLLELFEKND